MNAESIEREIEAMRAVVDPMCVPQTAAESVAISYRKWIVMRLGALVESPEEFDNFVVSVAAGRTALTPQEWSRQVGEEFEKNSFVRNLRAQWSISDLVV